MTLSVLRQPGLLKLVGGRGLSGVASQMQAVVLGWQVFSLTHRAFSLGLVGLAQFLPVASLVFVAGHAVDRGDRRRIAAFCQGAQAALSAGLAALSHGGAATPVAIYTVVFAAGAARAFEGPSLQALLPGLAPGPLLPRAAALAASVFQTAAIVGPSVGGLLYGIGPASGYAAAALGFAAAAALTATIPSTGPPPAREKPTLRSVFGGIGFIRSEPAILGAISLDLVAVLLGGATALLPIFAGPILHAGPLGLGLLRTAPSVGALLVSLGLARHPIKTRQGPVMFAAVALFGLATVGFGLSRAVPLSVLCLALLGGADVVSVVIRSTLIQIRTPDAMRGRVAAVNMLFIGSSNQLGEFESGSLAALVGAVPAVVLGGIGTLAVTALWAVLFPSLRRLDRTEEASDASSA